MFTGTCLALQPCPAVSPLDGALQKHLEVRKQKLPVALHSFTCPSHPINTLLPSGQQTCGGNIQNPLVLSVITLQHTFLTSEFMLQGQ